MFAEISRSEASHLLAPEQCKDHGAFWLRSGAQHAGQFEHSGYAGGIIVCTVVDVVSVHRTPNTKMIQMRAEKDDFLSEHGVAPTQDSNRIPRIGVLDLSHFAAK